MVPIAPGFGISRTRARQVGFLPCTQYKQYSPNMAASSTVAHEASRSTPTLSWVEGDVGPVAIATPYSRKIRQCSYGRSAWTLAQYTRLITVKDTVRQLMQAQLVTQSARSQGSCNPSFRCISPAALLIVLLGLPLCADCFEVPTMWKAFLGYIKS